MKKRLGFLFGALVAIISVGMLMFVFYQLSYSEFGGQRERGNQNVLLAPGEFCNEVRIDPGCMDCVCNDIVCAIDPFCCDTSWDDICVAEAIELCTVDNDCLFPHLGTGCVDSICSDYICEIDPYCCNVEWDSICVDEAKEDCSCKACEGDKKYFGIDYRYGDDTKLNGCKRCLAWKQPWAKEAQKIIDGFTAGCTGDCVNNCKIREVCRQSSGSQHYYGKAIDIYCSATNGKSKIDVLLETCKIVLGTAARCDVHINAANWVDGKCGDPRKRSGFQGEGADYHVHCDMGK